MDHEVLFDVAMQFGATLSLDRLMPLVLQRLVSMLGAERAMFALFDRDGGIERDIVHNMARAPGSPPPISTTAIKAVLQSETWFDWNASEDPELNVYESVRRARLKFVLAVPVSARNRVAGVMYVDSSAPVIELAHHRSTLTALARLVGTAVENAQLFEEQQFRAAWLAQLVHDLRSPLMVVSACGTELLEEPGVGSIVGDLADDIRCSASKMERLVNNTLRLVEVDADVEAPRPTWVDVAQTLRACARTLRLLAHRSDRRIVVAPTPDLPPAHSLEDRLDLVLDNLLFNALRYSPPGGEITLAVRLRADEGPPRAVRRAVSGAAQLFPANQHLRAAPGGSFLEVSVHNAGPAIASDRVDELFRPFVRGAANEVALGSSGLGLAIVDQCVRSLAGRVWIDASEAEGFRVSFTLPTQLDAEPRSVPAA